MSDATKRMRDFLTKSPSVVFPDEVLELFVPVEEENERLLELGVKWFGESARLEARNDRLRELVQELYEDQCDECDRWKYRDRMREFGIEVDG